MNNIIKGIYAHPKPFWETGAKLNDYGVNAIFTYDWSINDDLIKKAGDEGCSIFAEFATLNGKSGDYIKKHPEAHPIDSSGKPAPPATWFMGVCPTHSGFREFRMNALRELLEKYDLAGVWMDYLHWHAQFEDPYPLFFKTCFNDCCLTAFQEWADTEVKGKTFPEKAGWIFANAASKWEDWRVSVIVDWAREFRSIVKEIRPYALVGAFHCAWKDEDLGGIRRRCLGLDIKALEPHIDVFSPMVYHGRSGKPPEYVREYIEYFSRHYNTATEPGQYPRLWPIVQAHDDPRVTPEEFEQVLRYGLSAKSSGVMMFTVKSVAADPGKMAAMKKVYQNI